MRSRSLILHAVQTLISYPLFCGAVFAQDSSQVMYYEVAEQIQLEQRQFGAEAGASDRSKPTKLRFEALGRAFDIELVPNERLVANLRQTLTLAGELNVFRGNLRGVPGSWVRFSNLDGRMAGIVWDGHELFIVDSAEKLRSLISGNPSDDAMLVFRASDLRLRVDDVLHPGNGRETVRGDQLFAETQQLVQQRAANVAVPGRGIPLGLILDAEYPNTGNEEHALFPANIADGIHSAQVNIHLDVEYIHRFDQTTDPFESNNATVLLNQLPGIKSSIPALAPLGLAHFLTYRELDGEARGIAFLNSLCGIDSGTGLTEVRGSTLDGLIMAHEIAHNFGAPHDAEAGSACESTPASFLMAPTINGNQQFSACSLAQMEPVLNGASCLTAVADGDVSLSVDPVPPVVLVQQPFDLRFHINNLGNETSFDGLLESLADAGLQFQNFTVSNRSCGSQLEQQRRTCDLDTLYGGESNRVNVTIRPTAVGPASLQTAVSASNDLDPTNNDVSLEFDVLAATDLRPRSTVHSPNLRPGETTLITAHVQNDGAFETDAMLTIRTAQVNSVSTMENCTVVSFRWLECQLGNIPAGSTVERDFEFTVSDDPVSPTGRSNENVDLIVSSSLPDSSPGNNSHRPSVGIWGAFMDLTAEVTSAPTAMLVGESGELTLDFINNGPDTAPDGRAILRFFPQLTAESVSTSRGNCDLVTSGALCDWTDILAGERIEVRFRFSPDGTGPQLFSVETRHANAFDTDSSNNGANAEIISQSPPVPPPDPGARSAGGGSVSFLSPILGINFLARRIKRRRSTRRRRIEL